MGEPKNEKNERRRIDILEQTGRVCLNLGQAAVVAIAFAVVAGLKDFAPKTLIIIAGIIALAFFLLAGVCFYFYNRKNRNPKI